MRTAPVYSLVVMGVSGCGKSTVGSLLASHLGARFMDGDDLHPESNKVKMQAGLALINADRLPWLGLIGQALQAAQDSGQLLIVACSALKRSYRDVLRTYVPDLLFVHLTGDSGTLAARLAAREY